MTENNEPKQTKDNQPRLEHNMHKWVESTLGHGDVMCSKCLITNREAAMLGELNKCDE